MVVEARAACVIVLLALAVNTSSALTIAECDTLIINAKASSATVLDLSNCPFSNHADIHSDLWDITTLLTFKCNSCSWSTVPAEIGNFVDLTHIELIR
jgi:hypothetical protein